MWQENAACKNMDPNLFMSSKAIDISAARAVCLGCIVIRECLSYALANDEKGIWGGSTEKQRRRIKRSGSTETSITIRGVKIALNGIE